MEDIKFENNRYVVNLPFKGAFRLFPVTMTLV